MRSLSRRLFPLFVLMLTLFSPVAFAQIPPSTSSTSTPIPGAGHDYIGAPAETVNPASGTLSIRIPVIMPPGRGISLPFSFAYDSNSAANLESGTTTYAYPTTTAGCAADLSALCTKTSPKPNQTGALTVVATYTYDALNRLTGVFRGNLNVQSTLSYDAVGNLATVNYPNGVVHSYTYDNRNRLTNLGVTAGSANLFRYTYTLDAAGHRTGVTELSGRTVNYGYDSIYRLTSETIASDPNAVNGAATYTYDPVGNRTQKVSTIPGYPGGLTNYNPNDQISTDTYDNDGNTTASNGVGYVYDFENHLVQAGAGISIVYDGDGNRVSKTVAGLTTKYLVADNNPTGYAQVIEEDDSTGAARQYTYGLDLISRWDTNTGLSIYYVHDGHGSVRALTDSNGAVTDTYDYDAFGVLIHSTGTTPNNYLFASEQFDPDLGLYYNRARYLNVSTGRFWTPDTVQGGIDDPLSLHRYLYVHADPVDLVDPSGKTPLTDFVLLVATKGVYVTAQVFGVLAHQYIQRDIVQQFGPGQVLTELGITGGRIDVLILPNEVYEIKPFGGTVDPERQLSRYIDSAGDLFGVPLVRGTFQFERIIDGPLGLTQINYFTTSPGVIEYTAFPSVKLVATAIAFVLAYNTARLFLDLGAASALGTALAPGVL